MEWFVMQVNILDGMGLKSPLDRQHNAFS